MQRKAKPKETTVGEARKLNDELFKKANGKAPNTLLRATWEAAERLIDFHQRKNRGTA